MMKRSTKFLAILLSLVMVLALLPAGIMAESNSPTDTDSTAWQVSKSKTATALDKNDETTVTLSLPSAQETLTSDVVFVLDKSSCGADTAKAAAGLMTALVDSVQKNKADIKVGVVAFDGTSHILYNLAKFSGSAEEIAAISAKLADNTIPSSEHVSGTNMQAGLMAAKSMLDGDSDESVHSNHKYMVMVSDGLPRLFTGSDGKVKDIYYQQSYADPYGAKETADMKMTDFNYFGMIGEWTLTKGGSTEDSDYLVPYGDWNKYFSKLTDWVNADGDKYALDFATYGNDPTKYVKNATTGEIIDPDFVYIGHDEYNDHAMSVDRAVYEAYNQYSAMVNEGYSCYAINVIDKPFSNAFMGAMNELSGNNGTVDFDTVKNDIVYAINSGTVTDVIGNSFNLAQTTGTCPFTLTLNGEALTATADKNNTNKWNFSNGTVDNAYSVEYQPNATAGEQLVWTINVPVENANPVQLSYTLKLTRSTRAGTYNVPTNESATLAYLSTNDPADTTPKTETFEKPSVTYTVRSNPIVIPSDNPQPSAEPSPTPSTTPSPEPTDIPEPSTPLADLPEDLNSTDHITYIAGYPDGTVRPNGQITRAEVATAFYRLLTAARRDAVFTATPAYSDMNASLWYNKAVSSMANGKYVTGYPNGTFGGNKSITRAEFVAIAARFMNAKAGTVTFTDVPSSNWAYQYISTAVAYGWINGYPDGSFKPNQPITRAEAMKIINTMLARGVDAAGLMAGAKLWPDNANTAMWYYYEVEEATNNHLYTGTRPSESWTSLTTSYIYDMAKYERP